MCFKYEDFLHDYDGEEDYLGREDELSFVYSLDRAYAGDVEYMRVLGDVYSTRGHGVKTDFNKAIFWYEKAVESGDIYSAPKLGDIYSEYADRGFPEYYEKAFALYKAAAEEGIVNAISRLGKAYLKGDGCERDFAKARGLLERAADGGEREACYLYAHILKDEGAENWYGYLETSARLSYGKACWEIICDHSDEISDKQFLMCLVQAANDCSSGYNPVEAQLMAADCFMHGKRVKKDESAAKSYYTYAAERGSYLAKKALEKYFKN